MQDRLAAVRAAMQAEGIAGFLVPRNDEHLGEYVPANAERLAWLTGFTGSAGLAVVLPETAAVWSDGRYVLQLASQTDAALWERLHLTEAPPAPWIAARIGEGVLGYDPWLHSEEGLKAYREEGISLRPVARNPVDVAWRDRPAPPLAPAVPHDVAFAGAGSAEKREAIAASLRAARQDAAIITDPASIAWLLNIRGSDIPDTPVALGFGIAHADEAARFDLFMDARKLPPETRAALGNHVAIAERDAMPAALAALAGKRVRLDPAGTAAWFADRLREAGATIVAATDPCLLPKARKNETEQQGARAAHGRDAVALTRFLHALATEPPRDTEISAAARLNALRAEQAHFRGDSFAAICGAGEHGAIIHYRATPETDRPIRPNEVLLIDSGGQYDDGTTDVTRTIWIGPEAPPAEIRDHFTRVLKGHIAIATSMFPENVAGVRLDAFARAALWQAGLDYDHGTGHGVGSYLSVHEGPASISPYLRPATIAAGMILSNEPGYYRPGAYGIRIENLLLVRPADIAGEKPFLCFETLTLAPIDRALIEPGLLRADEIAWLDDYHARVHREVGPHLPSAAQAWLAASCAPLQAAA
ncbi:MAG TPA: aminopeptidase P family protein [Acetobacteraceae bacterium]|nr:aminopeptidase P family protein [Acetobacteraceae bacterium]